MPPTKGSFEPAFSDAERDELGHLHYLDARLDELRVRGLIAPEAYATVVAETQCRREAIELCGSYRNAITQAGKLTKKNPRDALRWAEGARELDPGREEAWDLIVGLHCEIGDADQAIACCAEAAGRFPRFQNELNQLTAARSKLAEDEKRQAERAREDLAIKGWFAQARLALDQGRDAEAIALGQQILTVHPNQIDALATTAFAQQRIGQFEQALTSYRTLCRLQPSNKTWSQWVRNVQLRSGAEHMTGKVPELLAQTGSELERAAGPRADEVASPPPPISWSGFAGEFLKEHAQELLLCLAVLLIVVSSTVGAHILLGDLLWSPVGKCTLAMVATLLFATLGAGLLNWGAARAGRMMLVATLIVVPIHFMLVGEMHLLHQPSAFRLAFLVAEAIAVVAMVRWVSGMVAPPAGARFLTATLLLLSVGSTTTARNSPLAWELQFASFQLSPVAFLGAVWILGARRWGDTSKDQRDFVYMMLGLLGFALLACLIRTGVYALRLDAALYALPAMLIAISCVHTARALKSDEPDSQRLALLRFGGYALSGLAFALVLASLPVESPVYFANTLAVSILGFCLYVASLRTDRHPAFLYLAFGAVAAGRLGAQYFLAGRLHEIEELVRQILAYQDHLPIPFRAIIGLIPNTVLAGLSLWFVRHWGDRRLAAHCHYIGLPLSIAACLWSVFEPLAAVICLSLYAILYLLAVWLFAVPWVSYLAAATLAGACYFGTVLVPGITLADQALAAALLGFAFWAARVELRRRQAASAYHIPWARAGLALAGVAMVAASWHLVTVGVGSRTGAGAFAVIAALAFLLNRERPRAIWAHLALVSFVEFTICGLGLAIGVQNLGGYHYGLLFVADALAMLATSEILRYWLKRSSPRAGADDAGNVVDSRWIGTMLKGISRSAIVLTAVGDGMGFLSIERTWLAGLVFLLGSVPLLWTTRLIRQQTLVYLGLAQLVAGTLELSSCAAGWTDQPALAGWLALTGALLGLGLWAVGIVGSRRPALAAFYTEPCFQAAFVLTVTSLVATNVHIVTAGAGSWIGAGAFAVITALAFLINRQRPLAFWAYLVLLGFVESTICGLGLAIDGRQVVAFHLASLFMFDGLLMLAAAEFLRSRLRQSEVQAAVDQTGGPVVSRWSRTLLAAIPVSTIVLTLVADGVGLLDLDRTWLAGLVLVLGSAPWLWTTRFVRHPALVYVGLAQFVGGTLDLASCAAGWNNATLLAGWLAVTTACLGLALWLAGTGTRRLKLSDFYTEPCFHTACFLMIGAYVVALLARGLGREAYPPAAATLGVNVLVTMLLARTWRRADLTYFAVFQFVTAIYLVLFSAGNNDPKMAYVLGLAAVSQAIALWGIGIACERVRDAWTKDCARPLYHWAVLLTGVAVLLSDRSSFVLALVSLSFLLTVKSLPGADWLYGTVAALLAACYFRWLGQLPRLELIGCATLAAFVLWGLGVLIQRYKPAVCQRLALREFAYEYPLFNFSLAVALTALTLRVNLSAEHQIAWTAQLWFTTALAALSLAMLRAYPARACVHTSLAFLTWSVVAAVAPALTSVSFVGLAGSSLAVALLLIERFLRPREPALCARLGVIDVGYTPVVRGWALGVFGLTVSLAIVVVVGEMSAAILGERLVALALTGVDWWVMLMTLGLIGIFLIALAGEPDGWGALGPEHFVVALHWVGIAVLWWVGVGCSPLMARVAAASDFYPLATVVAGLATARIVTRHTHRESWHELAWLGDLRSESMERLLSIQACVLTLLAVAFTRGSIAPATAMTLILASLTLGLIATATGWLPTLFGGGIAWSAGFGVTGLIVAERLGWAATGQRATCASVGVLTAAFGLLALAGWLRRDPSLVKGRSTWALAADPSLALPRAWAVEIIAFASSLIATVSVLAAGTSTPALGGLWTTVGVGVILGSALLHIMLVTRWHAEWLVYLAQAVMLAAYVDYRLAFSQPLAFDAIFFTLMGYLDLGIAEVLERLELKTYARPTRFFSLLIPVLPLLQLIGARHIDEIGLFHLMAAGTFYGIACGSLRWRTLGYAAAVLYNAALWVLWSRLGWTLSSHPQFFLVPVGLSTILFAEVNRRDLGRANVNTIRTVGLTIVYLSLAVPIWQYESFGAWVTLLIGSLVGVFVGIGLRLQTFLWMGLTTFVLDVVYEMGRVSLDYAFAKWAIMLALGIALVLFVALNEKKRIVSSMWVYFDQARLWE